MLPLTVPYRVELIYLTGIFELLGAIGVWIPRLTRLTGLLLIIMLIGILPANIYSAFSAWISAVTMPGLLPTCETAVSIVCDLVDLFRDGSEMVPAG